MFRQGDLEKARGYPVSPLMDRDKEGITKSQPGVSLHTRSSQGGGTSASARLCTLRLPLSNNDSNTNTLLDHSCLLPPTSFSPCLYCRICRVPQFFDIIVLPLFSSLAAALPAIEPLLAQV